MKQPLNKPSVVAANMQRLDLLLVANWSIEPAHRDEPISDPLTKQGSFSPQLAQECVALNSAPFQLW